MRRVTNSGGKQHGWSVGGCLPYQLPAWWALARNPSLIPWESAGACWVSQCCSERLPRGEQKPPEAVKKEPFVSICSAMCENAEFYRLEKDFPALFCVFREGSQWYPRVFTCKAIPADCAFPSNVHETFWSLFTAATLPAANNFSRLHSTRGRGALQQRPVLHAPLASKSLNPSKHSNNSPCKSRRK